MNIIIREMNDNDCRNVWKIEKACFSDPWSEELFHAQLNNKNAKILVAEESEIVGFINLWYVAGELTVNNIAVSEDSRRKGIAEMLMKRALEEYPQAECVLLEVRASNLPAQRLYRKMGFVQVGLRKNYYTQPTEDAWLMTLMLREDKNG